VSRPDFARLALPHMEALYRTARRLVARASEAEDLVQQTYLEGHRSFASLKDPARCRAWLFRILRHVWFHHRQRERVLRMGSAAAGEGAGNLEHEVLANGYSDEVERALAAMPDEFRTALLLVTVEDLSYEEVAEVMGCPIGTVRSRVARGRAQFAGAMARAAASASKQGGS
jgi:RNA polymerase sigma-70 factor (ECF subfamily)